MIRQPLCRHTIAGSAHRMRRCEFPQLLPPVGQRHRLALFPRRARLLPLAAERAAQKPALQRLPAQPRSSVESAGSATALVSACAASSPPARNDGSYAGLAASGGWLAEDFDHGMGAVALRPQARSVLAPLPALWRLRLTGAVDAVASGEGIATARLTCTRGWYGADAVAVDSEVVSRGPERSAVTSAFPAVSGAAQRSRPSASAKST